ncbi:MAG: AsmA-like C-terminal region-containing protein [Pseudomonadota bacterium]
MDALPTPRRRAWRFGFKVLVGFVGLGAVMLFAANLLAPSSWAGTQAVKWLKASTGYDLAIIGATRLTFRPFPHIEITDAVITEPNAVPGSPQLTVSRIEVAFGFLDLVGLDDAIERAVIHRPILALHSEGRAPNGQLRATPSRRPSREAGVLLGVAIEDLLIRNGTVLVHSARRSKPRRFERVNADLKLPALSAPATGRGQLNWKGKSFGFDVKLASPAALADEGRSQLQLTVDADTVSAQYDGDITTVPRLRGEGSLVAKTGSVRQFFAWLKGVSGALPVAGDGEMSADVAWTNEEIALDGIRFVQENARGKGHAKIALEYERPRIKGALVVDELNLGPVLAMASRGAPAGASAPLSLAVTAPPEHSMTSGAPSADPAIQVEQAVVPPPSLSVAADPRLLMPGPGVSQPSLTISMPQTAIDEVLAMASPSSAMGSLFDADLNLDIRKARLGDVQIGPSAVSLEFADGTLKAELWHMDFYGGDGRGALTVAVTNPIPRFSGDIRLEEVDTRSFLRDALGLERIGGKGRLTLNISGRSGNWDAMALSLMGNGAFAITEGAIDGIATPTLVRGLESGTIDLRPDPNAVLPISLLAGSFDINHGLASTSNLRLVSPSATIAADGVVNLPRENLDLVVKPGPVSKEQGGGVTATGEHLPPLRVVGPLARPVVGAASNPLIAGRGPSTSDLAMPGIVLRERRGVGRGNQLNRGSVAAGQTQQPSALAPSFGIAPQDSNSAPPLRMETLR